MSSITISHIENRLTRLTRQQEVLGKDAFPQELDGAFLREMETVPRKPMGLGQALTGGRPRIDRRMMVGMSIEDGRSRRTRMGAYVICQRQGHVLLARWIGPDGPLWTLVGGGVEFGEDPADAALRELTEETGYAGRLDRLLGIDSFRQASSQPDVSEIHSIRVVYAGAVTGGELRYERDGSTDRAAWIPLDQVSELDRVELVDHGLALDRDRPADGKPPQRRTRTWSIAPASVTDRR